MPQRWIVAALILAYTEPVSAQVAMECDSSGGRVTWRAHPHVTGVVRGTVSSARGQPIPYATVSVASDIVLTDSLGRFELRPRSSGMLEIVIRGVGYVSARDTIIVTRNLGAVVTASLCQSRPDSGRTTSAGIMRNELNIDSITGHASTWILTVGIGTAGTSAKVNTSCEQVLWHRSESRDYIQTDFNCIELGNAQVATRGNAIATIKGHKAVIPVFGRMSLTVVS